MTNSDSPEISSLLSSGQRKWLRGDDDALDGTPERLIRLRIKDRLEQSVSDMALIFRSDRLSSDDVMKSVRASTTSTADAGKTISSSGEMNEDMVADALDGALNQLEMASGEKVQDFDLTNLISQIRRVKGQHGTIDDETVLTVAVAGALAGLMGAGKTEKQARQWIDHHWPDSDEALEQWENAKDIART